MTNTHKLLTAVVAVALALLPSVASAGAGNNGNIVAGAMESKDHQTLVAAVRAAGLVDTLANGGPFTVFAPTDAAFAKLPAGTVDTLLEPANRDQLRAVLTYHVVPGKLTAGQLIKLIEDNRGKATLPTVQGGILIVSLSGGSVLITDASGGTARVTVADLIQSNGVIHVTDAVSRLM